MDVVSYTSVEFYICGKTYRYITWVGKFEKKTRFSIQLASVNVTTICTMVNMLYVQDMLI